jgi:hypothetical protein
MNCPKCKSESTAEIFWGYPGNLKAMEEQLDKKEIILGGCIVSDNDPKWECNSCHHQWGNRDD